MVRRRLVPCHVPMANGAWSPKPGFATAVAWTVATSTNVPSISSTNTEPRTRSGSVRWQPGGIRYGILYSPQLSRPAASRFSSRSIKAARKAAQMEPDICAIA